MAYLGRTNAFTLAYRVDILFHHLLILPQTARWSTEFDYNLLEIAFCCPISRRFPLIWRVAATLLLLCLCFFLLLKCSTEKLCLLIEYLIRPLLESFTFFSLSASFFFHWMNWWWWWREGQRRNRSVKILIMSFGSSSGLWVPFQLNRLCSFSVPFFHYCRYLGELYFASFCGMWSESWLLTFLSFYVLVYGVMRYRGKNLLNHQI